MLDSDQGLLSTWTDDIRIDQLRLNIEPAVEWTTNNMIEQIPSEDQDMFSAGSLDKEKRTRCSSYKIESTFLHWGEISISWDLDYVSRIESPSKEVLSLLFATWYLSTSKEQVS